MRNECLNYWYLHDSPHPVPRLVAKVGEKSQLKTMSESKRPYGVGILVGGYNEVSGTHLYETSPSGEYFEYYAQAIGSRSQSAKTYLEKNYEDFNGVEGDVLIKHAIKALRASAQEIEMNENNVSISIVGKDQVFKMLSEDELKQVLKDGEEDVDMA